ncbi:MAG TPA: hypothetical protein VFM34_06920 [Moraxellaceae bacterium]|nr:hypothetical protein [Moraxellaceae bacterium]
MKKPTNACAISAVALLCISLQGCASYWAERRADRLAAGGQPAEAVALLADLAQKDPMHYRVKYITTRDGITRDLLLKAQAARRQGRTDQAEAYFREIVRYDPEHADARQGLEVIARDRREAGLLAQARKAAEDGKPIVAGYLLDEILLANPQNGEARDMRRSLDIAQNRQQIEEPALAAALSKPVTLEFRNASLQAILEVLSQSSGLNFIFDRDVKSDLRTTIFARNTTVQDALSVILRTSQLSSKTLNASTLLIYPAVPDKEKQYEDLVIRTFYLGSADPKKAQEMIRTLVAPKAMYVDEKTRTLVVRDNLSTIQAVERLLAAYDIAPPEVVLEVEVFEVSDDSLLNVGVQFPDKVSASVYGVAGKAGQLTVDEVNHLGKGNFNLFFPDPLAVLNLSQTSGKANTLANPRIRVKSLEKAKILIGDKVPVITTTTNQTSSATTESVSYLDVGLKLEVQPEIHVNNDVSIDISLEVSNIIKEVKSTTGLLTYQIGARSANTSLRLRDGETQALAGLIKDEQRDSATHLPGLGKLPLIGHLFSNETNMHSKSEIVLLITPHVVRSLATPDANVIEFLSGTSANPSTVGFRLGESGQASTSGKLAPSPSTEAGPTSAVTPTMPTAAPETTPASTVPVPVLPPRSAGVPVKLDLGAPSKVQQGQSFTIPIMVGGEALEELSFELAIDPAVLKLLQVSPVANVRQLAAEQVPGGIRVTMTGVAAHAGPVAVLSLQCAQKSRDPIRLNVRNTTAHLPDNAEVAVQSGAERQLRILP